MTDSRTDATLGDPPARQPDARLSYRCVCGATFPVAVDAGGACPVCGRRVSPTVLAADPAATLSLTHVVDESPVGAAQRPAPIDADPIGQQYGHYRIVQKLGQGGMGVVYQALDESLQRYVALKVIHTAGGSAIDTVQMQRLLQEAIAQARVNHPNVVHIYYVGHEEKTPFFAMELVPGPNLADRLKDGPLPFAAVVSIAEQVADALRHAADFDIVHGDVKPSNILFADSGAVKLSDFGLARRLSEEVQAAAALAGTPAYLSPEAAAGQSVDVRSDMYSLGITLFEMTFGRLPYTPSGNKLMDMVEVHRTASIEFPAAWPDNVPHGWRGLLERLLAKSPDGRYPNYEELLAALRRLRPVDLPRAGRVQRGLAWLVDLAIAQAGQSLFYHPLATGTGNWLVHLVLAALGGLVPLLAALLQARWHTTPGKRLFQLRIVDRHGLTPPTAILAVRSVFQFFPLWAATAYHLNMATGRTLLAASVAAIGVLWLGADVGWALFSRKVFSLHDLLFKTQVVLDVPPAAREADRSA